MKYVAEVISNSSLCRIAAQLGIKSLFSLVFLCAVVATPANGEGEKVLKGSDLLLSLSQSLKKDQILVDADRLQWRLAIKDCLNDMSVTDLLKLSQSDDVNISLHSHWHLIDRK